MNMRRLNWIVFGMLALLAACTDSSTDKAADKVVIPTNKFDNPIIQKIYDFADHRNADSLLPYLDNADPMIRREAAMAFGSVQGTAAGSKLMVMIEDENLEVSKAAAWAIGQIGDSSFTEGLLNVMVSKPATDMPVYGEALGKAGMLETLNEMMDLQASGGLPANSENAVMQAVYRAGLRGVIPNHAQAFAFKTLESSNPEAQVYAAAFLGRVRKLDEISDFEPLNNYFAADHPEEAKIQLVKAYRRCNAEACTEKLREIAADPKQNILTRVNAFGAAKGTHDLDEVAMNAAKESGQVGVAAVEYLQSSQNISAGELLDLSNEIQAWRPRALVLRAALKNCYKEKSSEMRKAIEARIDSLLVTDNPYEKGYLYAALSESSDRHNEIVEVVLNKERIVSTLAAESIADNYANYLRREMSEEVQIMQKFVETGDPAIMAIAAEFFSRDDIFIRAKVKSSKFLEDALAKLKLPEEIETYNGIEKAIAVINDREPNPKTLDFQNPINWDLIKTIPKNQQAVITTNKGKIVFELLVEAAPGTVANFVQLVKDGFYDGKSFHRIVPAFVAQGGCPRGDGYGSSPKSIRSEWPELHYVQGMVGMASAGKDTESCQWFITHCYTPHLDGRYTIFAKVVEGMDIVQGIEIGDAIEKVEIVETAA